jgi:hypothetical protein
MPYPLRSSQGLISHSTIFRQASTLIVPLFNDGKMSSLEAYQRKNRRCYKETQGIYVYA